MQRSDSGPRESPIGTIGPAASSVGALFGTAARFIERAQPDVGAESAVTSPRGPQLPDARNTPSCSAQSSDEEGAGLVGSWRRWRALKARGKGGALMPEFQLECHASRHNKAPLGIRSGEVEHDAAPSCSGVAGGVPRAGVVREVDEGRRTTGFVCGGGGGADAEASGGGG